MNSSSFMTRILWIGAIGVTLISSFYIVLLAADIPDAVRHWQDWAHFENINQWLRIPGAIFMIFLLLVLNAAVWRRLFRRYTALRSFSNSRLNPLLSRSKYAVWSHVSRPGRLSAVNVRRTRKRLRHAFPHPAPFRAVPSADRPGSRPARAARPISRRDPAEAGAETDAPQPALRRPAEQ